MLNKVILMGRLASDPTLRETAAGKSVSNFTLAIEDEWREDTTYFFDLTAWGHNADFIHDYFAKGDMIAVSGHLITTPKKTKDGSDYLKPIVTVDEAYFTKRKVDMYGE